MKNSSASYEKNRQIALKDSNASKECLRAREKHLADFRTLDTALKGKESCVNLGKRWKDYKPKTSSQLSLTSKRSCRI